jgi:GDP-L-fucose synthase
VEILVTGANGLVGKTLVKKLMMKTEVKILTPTSKELDLRKQEQVDNYFKNHKIKYVYHLAAKVGGIKANIDAPAEFLYDNLMITANVIETARKYKVKKLLNLGSSCIYPKECEQPMKENRILTGVPEPTNEGYAIAKIAGLKLCEKYNQQYNTKFISLMPCNIYGGDDHFDPEKAHVIPSLIYKFHKAKIFDQNIVEVWGSGNAKREFIYVEDVADAMIYFMKNYEGNEFVNIGPGYDIRIKELALMIKKIVKFQGEVLFNSTKPEGMKQKVLDVTKSAKLGWKAKTTLEQGIKRTYGMFLTRFPNNTKKV